MASVEFLTIWKLNGRSEQSMFNKTHFQALPFDVMHYLMCFDVTLIVIIYHELSYHAFR